MTIPTWFSRAACHGADTDLFIVRTGSYRDYSRHNDNPITKTAQAKEYCKRCPVVAECLEWAYEIGDKHAILGGMTPKERITHWAKIRRQMRTGILP